MIELWKIKDRFEKLDLTAEAALDEIFRIYLYDEEKIKAEKGIYMKHHGYEIFQVRGRDDCFLHEGSRNSCLEYMAQFNLETYYGS